MTFALAHNGVLHNDRALRKSLKLPSTKIETDSYVAVQLIQKKRALNFNSLKYMAEKVEGSFSFTVLDEQDNLYSVKGDSPLCICHYPNQRLYLYASTEAILLDVLRYIPFMLGASEQVFLNGGDILAIGPDGEQQKSGFQYDNPFAGWGFEYWGWPRQGTSDQIDQLLHRGFTPEDIEEYLYCSEV